MLEETTIQRLANLAKACGVDEQLCDNAWLEETLCCKANAKRSRDMARRIVAELNVLVQDW